MVMMLNQLDNQFQCRTALLLGGMSQLCGIKRLISVKGLISVKAERSWLHDHIKLKKPKKTSVYSCNLCLLAPI